MFRARLNTAFGSIEVEFEDEGQLEQAIAKAREFSVWISSNASDFTASRESGGDPYKDLRSITAQGKLQLLAWPKNKGDIVRLGVFLAPKAPTWADLVEATGVANPLAYIRKGELTKDPNGCYSLEAKSRQYVTNILIPSLRRQS